MAKPGKQCPTDFRHWFVAALIFATLTPNVKFAYAQDVNIRCKVPPVPYNATGNVTFFLPPWLVLNPPYDIYVMRDDEQVYYHSCPSRGSCDESTVSPRVKTEGVLRGQLQLLIPAATPADSGVYALRIFVNEEPHSAYCNLSVAAPVTVTTTDSSTKSGRANRDGITVTTGQAGTANEAYPSDSHSVPITEIVCAVIVAVLVLLLGVCCCVGLFFYYRETGEWNIVAGIRRVFQKTKDRRRPDPKDGSDPGDEPDPESETDPLKTGDEDNAEKAGDKPDQQVQDTPDKRPDTNSNSLASGDAGAARQEDKSRPPAECKILLDDTREGDNEASEGGTRAWITGSMRSLAQYAVDTVEAIRTRVPGLNTSLSLMPFGNKESETR